LIVATWRLDCREMTIDCRDSTLASRGKRFGPSRLAIRRARLASCHARQGILSHEAMGLVSRIKRLAAPIKDHVATIKHLCHERQGVLSRPSKLFTRQADALIGDSKRLTHLIHIPAAEAAAAPQIAVVQPEPTAEKASFPFKLTVGAALPRSLPDQEDVTMGPCRRDSPAHRHSLTPAGSPGRRHVCPFSVSLDRPNAVNALSSSFVVFGVW